MAEGYKPGINHLSYQNGFSYPTLTFYFFLLRLWGWDPLTSFNDRYTHGEMLMKQTSPNSRFCRVKHACADLSNNHLSSHTMRATATGLHTGIIFLVTTLSLVFFWSHYGSWGRYNPRWITYCIKWCQSCAQTQPTQHWIQTGMSL